MATRFEVTDEFLFIGRTFEEYREMFDLRVDGLRGRTVLDCPGGPGAFAAVAAQVAADVTAVDPMYRRSLAVLETACVEAVERDVEQLHEKRDLFVWDRYGDVETRGRYLRAATERFLADYATHPGRYVAGALPHLPFATDAFDLALSGNLLFLYDDRLDYEFHLSALRELARVAGEVRVFTLASLDRSLSEYVEPVTARLRRDGLSVDRRQVPYEFQPGATEMLVVSTPTDESE